MAAQLSSIKNDALSLPDDERAELAKELLLSLDGAVEPKAKKAWDIEICRRINEVESGQATLFDVHEVLAKVKRRLNTN